jgi:membrane dipeptidase
LATLAATGGGLLFKPDAGLSQSIDPRVRQIVSGMIAIDMHSHVQIPFARENVLAKPDADADLIGEMRRAGFSAICQTYNLDALPAKRAGDYYNYYLQAMAFEDRLLAHNHMRRALDVSDLQSVMAGKEPVIIQSVEGAQFIEGKLERLQDAYSRGLRHLQLVHERDDLVRPLGDVYTAAAHLGGLTPFGGEVITACNRLGIVVDLAHGTREMVIAALKVAKQPLIISHAGLKSDAINRSISDDQQRRLITEDHARAVIESGGIVGIWWRMFDTTKEYVSAIKARADAWGVDHVGIGTDTDLTASYVLPYTNKIWPDENGGFFYALVSEMLRQGFSREDIAKIGGGNFVRLFASITSRRP